MSNKLTVLDDVQDFMLTCQKQDEADAIEWAIDQLRWRRVEDELPDVSGNYQCIINGRVFVLHWFDAWMDDDRDNVVTPSHWRPITLPEGE